MDENKSITSGRFGKLYIGFIIAILGLLFTAYRPVLYSIITISIIVILVDIISKTNIRPDLSRNLQNFEKYMIIVAFLLVLALALFTGCYNLYILPGHIHLPPGTINAGGPPKITPYRILIELILPIVSLIGLVVAYIGVEK